MASKYDDLDASTELEQTLAGDLRAAFGPRGCEVVHHGANNGGLHSPGGRPDIEIRDEANSRLILVEVTKRKSSAADGEFLAITDHLHQAIKAGGYSSYEMLYVSPATSPRMSLNIRDLWNRTRVREGLPGRIVALDFAGIELALRMLATRDPALYPAKRLGDLFERWEVAVDDARARQLIQATLFPEDHGLALDLSNEAAEVDAERERTLKKQLERIEDKLRNIGITGNEANVTLVQLAFVRLYEDRRQRQRGLRSRFTQEGFMEWRETVAAQLKRQYPDRLIQVLVQEIAEDPYLREVGLLHDPRGNVTLLNPHVTDTRVNDLILSVFDQYDFNVGRVDVLGAVFETLARRSEKDTRVGQFFTPQQVVDFCAKLVHLRPTDVVLDPAVGTARFLIAAMERMLDNADDSTLPLDAAETSIRSRQLIGTDIDDWVATIAKMNMFIHGDGKSNIGRVNGLIVGDTQIFDAYPDGLAGKVDVVLTNPPLGDTSYIVAAEHWRERNEGRDEADSVEFLRGLHVVPIRAREELDELHWHEKVGESDSLIAELERMAPEDRSGRALQAAYRTRSKRALRVDSAQAALAAGNVTWQPQGETMKGGALFLGALANYLAAVRDSREPIEWRGGHAAIVVDEAILNTPVYASTRAFIREHFYVKAVISLSRDAFKYLAHTDAKTSVLFLTRKPHAGVLQNEPIFFAHADRVGYSAEGAWVGDDLPQILVHYELFRSAVRTAYRGAHFNAQIAMDAVRDVPGFANAFFALLEAGDGRRLDFYDARFQQRAAELRQVHGTLQTLGDVLEVRAGTPPEPSRTSTYDFAYVAREGEVRPKRRTETKYSPRKLWVVEEGDLIVSGIDLVWGAVGVATSETAGMVMSNEMYAYRVKDPNEAIPEFLQLVLGTTTANEMLWGLTTGTSNRTRLENAEQLLALPIPPLPAIGEQRRLAEELRQALGERTAAIARYKAAHQAVQANWDATPRPTLPHARDLPVVEAHLV